MNSKNDKECMYCNKVVRFDKLGKHILEKHQKEVVEAFNIYTRIKVGKPPIESKSKSYSLCFCCAAYFKTSGGANSKPSLKHTEKCSLEEQLQALKNYCSPLPDAATLAKQEREETIELDTNEIEEADIDNVTPVVVQKKKEPVTLYRELQPVKCEHCEELEQEADEMTQSYSEKCAQIADLETQLNYQLGYEIAINTYKQKVERLEHAIQIKDKQIKELSKFSQKSV